MNKNDLLKNLEKLDMRPGRGLGQNFLLDNNLLDFIVRSADITPGETVLEVGPGFGALTEKLLASGLTTLHSCLCPVVPPVVRPSLFAA